MLTLFTAYLDFVTKNKYPQLVPPGSMFFSHPIDFISQFFTIYKMHKEAENAEMQIKRQRKQNEAIKRRDYLRAHGMEKEGPFGMGTVEGDDFRQAKQEERARMSVEEMARAELAKELGAQRERERQVAEGDEVRDSEGNVIQVKKRFGIW